MSDFDAIYQAACERHPAFHEGKAVRSIVANPYWREHPKPSAKGLSDEIAARFYVDGCVSPAPPSQNGGRS